jgi:alkanesulfonate monooxygenase SsuD/methylene tetrahydromethanopterin reductase-like flavin-dependent oxidoreductase (luciferase family)
LIWSPCAKAAPWPRRCRSPCAPRSTPKSLGFARYWLAEHHNMPGIASSATAVLVGHIAGAPQRIRVGSGGVMLPNHAPLVVAEAFGTLAELYPGRIDLGLGRAPGTDPTTMRALRRSRVETADDFPQDVAELQRLLAPCSRASAWLPCPARAPTCRSGCWAPACFRRNWPPNGPALCLCLALCAAHAAPGH